MDLLETIKEQVYVQAEHDWKQVKPFFDLVDDHFYGITAGIVGIPVLLLGILEGMCYFEIWQINMLLH